MINMQALVDAMSASGRQQRQNYHLTLADAIATLRNRDPGNLLEFDHGGGPAEPHSYRGYYSDLAFETGAPTTVGAFLKDCTESLDKTFEGYKGGDFVMDGKTPLWNSSYGSASGRAIIGINADGGKVLLLTKQTD